MSRFIFELATPEDSTELLEILEETSFTGNISLLYTRRPDAYHSFMREGPHVDIVVCRDLRQQKIAGFGACALRKLFINGQPETVGYLFGLRMRREYMRRFPLLHKGYAMMRTLHQKKSVVFYMTTILNDNHDAQRLLEKRRPSMPAYIPCGFYRGYALRTRRSRKQANSQTYQFSQATSEDFSEVLDFLRHQGATLQFFPMLDAADFQSGALPGLTREHFYCLRSANSEILAAGALWDQTSYKQYIVQGYRGIFKLLRPVSRLLPHIGIPQLPEPGSVLKFFTLSFWAVKEQSPAIFKIFLHHVTRITTDYPFFFVGIHERSPLCPVLEKHPHISYGSKVYVVTWDEQQQSLNQLEHHRGIYLECGML